MSEPVPGWWFIGPSARERPSSHEVEMDSIDLDGPPTCLPGGSSWSGMHCLHPTGLGDGMGVRCCGPCGALYTNPTNNTAGTASSAFQYRLGATHAEPGPFWAAVRAAMPKPKPLPV